MEQLCREALCLGAVLSVERWQESLFFLHTLTRFIIRLTTKYRGWSILSAISQILDQNSATTT